MRRLVSAFESFRIFFSSPFFLLLLVLLLLVQAPQTIAAPEDKSPATTAQESPLPSSYYNKGDAVIIECLDRAACVLLSLPFPPSHPPILVTRITVGLQMNGALMPEERDLKRYGRTRRRQGRQPSIRSVCRVQRDRPAPTARLPGGRERGGGPGRGERGWSGEPELHDSGRFGSHVPSL